MLASRQGHTALLVYEAESPQTSVLGALYALSKQLRVAKTPGELYPILVHQAMSLIRAEHGALALLEPDGKSFRRACTEGIPAEKAGSMFSVNGSLSGQVVRTGRPWVALHPVDDLLRRGIDVAPYRHLGPVAIVPMRSDSRVIGTLLLARGRSPAAHPFTDAEVRLLNGIAEMGGMAIHRLQLHQNLEKAYFQMVVALARAVDARDSYTGDHSERIAMWAEAVAGQLGCDQDAIQDIRWAALLHDIGKIGIPDSILRKPRSLTESEWNVMRRHPEIGEEILKSVERMRGVATLVRHHQERWDGTGYPDRLSGKEIPLGARILAVLDAYSAITDDRPYRKARGHRDAIEEIRRCAGTQFDPRVVKVFCRVVRL